MLAALLGGLSLVALAVLVVTDYTSDYWVEHPMTAAVISALLVAAVLGAIVDRFIDRRNERRWRLVAAVALGEMAQNVRTLRDTILETVAPEVTGDAPAIRQRLRPGGDLVAPLSAAVERAATDPATRTTLLTEVAPLLDGGGETLGRWGTIMLQSGDHVQHLDEFTGLLARTVKFVHVLDGEKDAEGRPYDDRWVADRLAQLIEATLADEEQLVAASRRLAPVGTWTQAPAWLRASSPG